MAVRRLETHIKGSLNHELYLQTWTPDEVRGRLLITHGQAEHSECYQRLAENLANDGWLVYAWDLIGHGRSEGRRGYANEFRTYVKDLKAVIDHLRTIDTLDHPFILFSHSMGGLITLEALLDEDLGSITAAVFSSPALGFSMQVPAYKKIAAQLALQIFPQLTMHNEIGYNTLTRDVDMLKSYERDTLRHGRISSAVFFGFLEGFERIPKEAEQIQIPVFFQLAGEDQVTNTPAAKAVYEKMSHPKNRIEIYHDSFHEIYNDLDREQVISDLKDFINSFR